MTLLFVNQDYKKSVLKKAFSKLLSPEILFYFLKCSSEAAIGAHGVIYCRRPRFTHVLYVKCYLDLGPSALLAQQVCVAVRLLPLLLVGVSPHQLPVTQVADLLPLLLAANTLLVPGPGLKHRIHFTHQYSTAQVWTGRTKKEMYSNLQFINYINFLCFSPHNVGF